MASLQHQRIAGLIATKMRMKGYTLVSFDGKESIISTIPLEVVPKIKRHKPDLIGVNLENKTICIGEAKTKNDLLSKRTKEQFIDFSNLILSNNIQCELIIGVPTEAKTILNKLLKENNLDNKNNISFIYISEVLLYDKTED